MMKKAIACIVVLVLAVFYAAAGPGVSFSHLTVDDGLSNNLVSSICQDSRGNIWIGTNDGINFYNGYDIRVFKHDPGNESSIPSNIINYLYRDRKGTIWACTANGLAWFDERAGQFRRVGLEGVHSVEIIVQLSDNCYLFSTRNNSWYYDAASGETRLCLIGGGRFRCYSIEERAGNFLVGTMEKSVELLRFEDGELKRRTNPVHTPHNVGHVLFADDSHAWGSCRGQLIFIDFNAGTLSVADWVSPLSETVSSLRYDDRGRLWIGNDRNIRIFDFTTRTGEVLTKDASDPKSLSFNSIKTIFRDAAGGMWVGTEFGGVNYWNGRVGRFETIRPDGLRGKAGDSIVSSMFLDSDGTIWIGSRSEGLSHYFPESGKTLNYDINNIRSIYCPPEGNLVYVGTVISGWCILDKRSGAIRRIKSPSDVNAILPAANGCLWLGSLSGLFIYDTKTGGCRKAQLPAGTGLTRVLTLFYDSSGHLWVGAKESLREYRCDTENNLQEIPHRELDNLVQIQCLYETPDSVIWIGTADGLFSYDQTSSVLRSMNDVEALSQTTIKGIEQDGQGRLWISTDSGLTRFDPADGSHRTYYYEDGLQSNQFNAFSSHCKDAFGKMYFGGIGGISVFNPADIADDKATASPEITGLRLFNTSVTPGDASGILHSDISCTRKITLKHRQNSISISFACPDFASEGRNSFYYKLEGFDSGWIQARNREASYVFHEKGNYIFKVKVANKDGFFDPRIASLGIRVLPVWYKSTLAKVIMLLIALFIIMAAEYRLYIRLKEKNEERIKETERNYEERMRRARLLSYAESPYTMTAQNEEFLIHCLDYTENNLANPQFSVEMLSEELGMTRMNLYRRIKSITGLTPVEIIRKIRIEKACQLIRTSGLSLAEIGETVGFNSPSYFNASFKKEVGCTPGEYSTSTKKA